MRELAAPGSRFIYSGGGFALLQMAVTNVVRVSFSRFMDAAIFRPLGMTRRFYGNREESDSKIAYHVDESGSQIIRAGYGILAAAALYTTVVDFAKLAREDATCGAAVPGILRPEDFEQMEVPAPGNGGIYGLGYFTESHSGWTDGWARRRRRRLELGV